MAAWTEEHPDSSRQTRDHVLALIAALANADLAPYLKPDVTLTAMMTGEISHGRAAVNGLLRHLHQHAFITTPEVRNVVASGTQAIAEIDLVGVHTGTFAGIAPSGVTVRLPYVLAFDLEAGAVGAIRSYLPWDSLVRLIRQAP